MPKHQDPSRPPVTDEEIRAASLVRAQDQRVQRRSKANEAAFFAAVDEDRRRLRQAPVSLDGAAAVS